MKQSKLFSLNIYDFLKGLIIGILTPILVLVQSYFASGKLDIELSSIIAVGLSGLIAYLLKNFFSDVNLPQVNANDFQNEENGYIGGRPEKRR